MPESYPNGQKTLWENEKLIITSNFSFSHSIFKGRVAYYRHLKTRAYLGDGKDLRGCANNKYGFVDVDYYFYASKTQKGYDGIVLFENYGQIFFTPCIMFIITG